MSFSQLSIGVKDAVVKFHLVIMFIYCSNLCFLCDGSVLFSNFLITCRVQCAENQIRESAGQKSPIRDTRRVLKGARVLLCLYLAIILTHCKVAFFLSVHLRCVLMPHAATLNRWAEPSNMIVRLLAACPMSHLGSSGNECSIQLELYPGVHAIRGL